MASFVETERLIRNSNKQGYKLWQHGTYPFRVLMLDCPDGTTRSYDILAQVEEHFFTGIPQAKYPNEHLDSHNREEKERDNRLRVVIEKVLKDYGIGLDTQA